VSLRYGDSFARAPRRQTCRARQSGDGAVSMVEMALDDFSKNHVVEFDEDRKAAMVSNLMVVLCGESQVTPVVNTGTLYT